MGPLMSGWRKDWNIVPATDDDTVLFHDKASGNLFLYRFILTGTVAMQEVWTDTLLQAAPATLHNAHIRCHPRQIVPVDFFGTGREFFFISPRQCCYRNVSKIGLPEGSQIGRPPRFPRICRACPSAWSA